MTTETKTRIITLTDRPPVKIREEEWPVIARAKDYDGQIEYQADRTWRLIVRQHKDGRSLVYGVYETQFQGESDCRGGQLCAAGADLAAAIRSVGEDTGMPEGVIRRCIADLPAEEI